MTGIVLSPLPALPVDDRFPVGLNSERMGYFKRPRPYSFVFYNRLFPFVAAGASNHILSGEKSYLKYIAPEFSFDTRVQALRWWSDHIPHLNRSIDSISVSDLLRPIVLVRDIPQKSGALIRREVECNFCLILAVDHVAVSCTYSECDGGMDRCDIRSGSYSRVGEMLVDVKHYACRWVERNYEEHGDQIT